MPMGPKQLRRVLSVSLSSNDIPLNYIGHQPQSSSDREFKTVLSRGQDLSDKSAQGRSSASSMDIPSRKRRKVELEPLDELSTELSINGSNMVKHRLNLLPCRTNDTAGLALFLGVGDTGQLGLGPDITERSRPARLNAASLDILGIDSTDSETFFQQVCAGGMHTVCVTKAADVLTCGCNDEGALGRQTSTTVEDDSDDMKSQSPKRNQKRPRAESVLEDAEQIVDEMRLGRVQFPFRVQIAMVSAGDSHTAALDTDGQVWLWGTFRGSSGAIGLTQPGEISWTARPIPVYSNTVTSTSNHALASPNIPNGSTNRSASFRSLHNNSSQNSNNAAVIVKIASGQDHLIFLADDGRLYTMGCGEQGQLGRIAERFAKDGGRSGIGLLLQPAECRLRGSVRFSDAWAGGFATFARCQSTGVIYACGLNNYGQLALVRPQPDDSTHDLSNGYTDDYTMVNVVTDRKAAAQSEAALIAKQGPLVQFMLTPAHGFAADQGWRQFAVSMHHTLALDSKGHVYAAGRPDYGRLGLGQDVLTSKTAISTPRRVLGPLSHRNCVWIGCGEACSFAIDSEGIAYSWGMGSNRQLGHGDSDSDSALPCQMQGKNLEGRRVLQVDAGGQHTVLLVAALPLTTPDTVGQISVSTEQPIAQPTIQVPYFPPPAPVLPSDKISVNGNMNSADTALPLILGFDNSAGDKSMDKTPDCLMVVQESAALVTATGQTRRVRHLSPSVTSLCGANIPNLGNYYASGGGSTTDSTAAATINSSLHSSAVPSSSDASSVSSCASGHSSSSSQLNSARSTDGGGSSRQSSLGTYSVQSSLLLPAPGDDPLSAVSMAPLVVRQQQNGAESDLISCFVNEPNVPFSSFRSANQNSSALSNPLPPPIVISTTASVPTVSHAVITIVGGGMSVCSTSSEPGVPTDTASFGSMTASPADVNGGESGTF